MCLRSHEHLYEQLFCFHDIKKVYFYGNNQISRGKISNAHWN